MSSADDRPRAGRTVFLTSGNGPVGRAAARAFTAAGHGVMALMPETSGGAPGVTALAGGLAQIARMASTVQTADSIVHIAEPADTSREAALAHIDHTADLLELWRFGTLLYLSTMGVYGTPRDSALETHPPAPQSWPAVAAYTNERQISMATPWPRRGGAVVLRAALLLDADPAAADGFLPAMIEQVRAERTFVFESAMALSSHGTAFVGANDLARAMVALSESREDGVFNVASGFCTWRDLLDAIGRALGVAPRMTIRPDLALHRDDVLLPPSRLNIRTDAIQATWGFAPADTLDGIVRAAVEAPGDRRSHLRAVT